MSVSAGYAGVLKFAVDSTGSPGTFYDLAHMNAESVAKAFDDLDITSFSSAGWKERIKGLGEVKISSLTGDFDPADTTGQVALRSAIDGRSYFWLKLLVDGTNGLQVKCVGNYTLKATVAGKTEFEVEVQSSGAPTAVP